MSGLYQRTTESLEGLTDVNITNIQNGQAPVYNATQEVYTNQTVLTPADLPSGSSGDVIISNGTGGIESTINLNVNPSNGIITGSYVNVNSSTVKLASGALTATDAIGIGWNAGLGASNKSVSIGTVAGGSAGESSVSLGYNAKASDANCIVINSTGALLQSGVASSCRIDPIRDVNATGLTTPHVVQYNDTTKEVIKSEDLHTRNILNGGTLTNTSTASLYNGQLTVGVTANKIINGSNTLVVDFAGNKVGVNQLTPAEALDVNGNVKLNGKIEVSNGVGTPGQVLSSNGGSAVTWINQASSTPIYANSTITQPSIGATNTTLNAWSSQVSVGITSAGTNLFTTPTAGWYQLSFSLDQRAAGAANNFRFSYIYILRNGTVIHEIVDNDPASELEDARTKGGGFLVLMAIGDVITFNTNVNSGNYTVTGMASFVKVS